MDHLHLIESESAAFLDACLAGDPGVDVPACPGWTITDLLGHLGVVQRYHGGNLTRGVTTPPDHPRPTPPETGLADWFREGTALLLDNLAALPADAPAWGFGPGEPTVAFWQRRMVHEALVHRLDAEMARGTTATPVDPVVADDAVAEYLEVFLARRHRPGARARRAAGGPHRRRHPPGRCGGAGDRGAAGRRGGGAAGPLGTHAGDRPGADRRPRPGPRRGQPLREIPPYQRPPYQRQVWPGWSRHTATRRAVEGSSIAAASSRVTQRLADTSWVCSGVGSGVGRTGVAA